VKWGCRIGVADVDFGIEAGRFQIRAGHRSNGTGATVCVMSFARRVNMKGKVMKPDDDDFLRAADWLRRNRGGDGEDRACGRVADWLDAYVSDLEIRRAARESGVPVSIVRERIKSP
jgi:hypothetical protein